MPINQSWRPAARDHVRLNAPTEPGIYELKSFGDLVFIGAAEDVRAAIVEHLEDRSPNYYRYATPDLLESVEELYEHHRATFERVQGGPPPWNEPEATA